MALLSALPVIAINSDLCFNSSFIFTSPFQLGHPTDRHFDLEVIALPQ